MDAHPHVRIITELMVAVLPKMTLYRGLIRLIESSPKKIEYSEMPFSRIGMGIRIYHIPESLIRSDPCFVH